MRPILTLTAIIAALALTGCGASTKFTAKPPILAGPDAGLETECRDPVTLPNRRLNQKETEGLWGRDRSALIECGSRHRGLKKFYINRDSGLQKQKKDANYG